MPSIWQVLSRTAKASFLRVWRSYSAIMRVFGIRLLRYCGWRAQRRRDGDMLSRMDFHDVRDDSVGMLIDRFGVDKNKPSVSPKTAGSLFNQVHKPLELSDRR